MLSVADIAVLFESRGREMYGREAVSQLEHALQCALLADDELERHVYLARKHIEHAVPAIQLMRFETGEAAGTYTLRFCHFNHRGHFQRSPMMISDAEIDRLRDAIAETPEIHRLLQRLVAPKPRKGKQGA